jgi:hypothetical protein
VIIIPEGCNAAPSKWQVGKVKVRDGCSLRAKIVSNGWKYTAFKGPLESLVSTLKLVKSIPVVRM